MKYRIILPKYFYYIGLLVHVILTLLIVYIYTIAINSGQLDFILILGLVASIFLFLSFTFITRLIYVTIDLENNKIIYGNIFFYQETSTDNIQQVKKIKFLSSTYKIEIFKNKYIVSTDFENGKFLSSFSKN